MFLCFHVYTTDIDSVQFRSASLFVHFILSGVFMFKQISMPPFGTQVQVVGSTRRVAKASGNPYFQLECYGVLPGFLYPQAFETNSQVDLLPGFYDVNLKFKITGRDLNFSFDFASLLSSAVVAPPVSTSSSTINSPTINSPTINSPMNKTS